MSTMLMELMHHLQDVHTHHPFDDGRVIVAVHTTPHALEQFEVGEVHHDGPSVVLYCQPLQDEEVTPQDEQDRPQDEQDRPQDEQDRPQDEQDRPAAKKTRACVHNDYEDLL
jgi:hypothetical protein